MHQDRPARLSVIAGPMFAGKTEELLRRVRRARLAGQEVEVIGHHLDVRHGHDRLASHTGASMPARTADADDLARALSGHTARLLAIDEAQFFGESLVDVVQEQLRSGTDVVVAGLCVTFDARPYEPVPTLMALAEEVLKLTAVCAVCGADAAFHQRIGRGEEGVADPRRAAAEHVGGSERYQARCRLHLEIGDSGP